MSYYKGSGYGGSRGGYRGGSSSYRGAGGAGGGGNDSSWRGGRGGSSFSSSRAVSSSSGGGGSSRYYPSSPPSSSYESRSRSSYVGGNSASDRYSSRRDESYNRYPEMSSYGSREYGRGSSPEPPRKRVRADSPSYIELGRPPPNSMQPRYSSQKKQINTIKSESLLQADAKNDSQQESKKNESLTETCLTLPCQRTKNEPRNISTKKQDHSVSLCDSSGKLSSKISCYSSASTKEINENCTPENYDSIMEGKYESNLITVINSVNENEPLKINDSGITTEVTRVEETCRRENSTDACPQGSSNQSSPPIKKLPGNQRRRLKKLANLLGSSYEEIFQTCVVDCNNSGDKIWREDLKDLVAQLESTAKKKINQSTPAVIMNSLGVVSSNVGKKPVCLDSQNQLPLTEHYIQLSPKSDDQFVNESHKEKVYDVGNKNDNPSGTSQDHLKSGQIHKQCWAKKDKILNESPGESLSSSSNNYIASKAAQNPITSLKTQQKKLKVKKKSKSASIEQKNALKKSFFKFLESLEEFCGIKEIIKTNDTRTTTELSGAKEPCEENRNKLKNSTDASQGRSVENSQGNQREPPKKRLPRSQKKEIKKLASLLGRSYYEMYQTCVIGCSNSGDEIWCKDLNDLVTLLEENPMNCASATVMNPATRDSQDEIASNVGQILPRFNSLLTKLNIQLSSKSSIIVSESHKEVVLDNNVLKTSLEHPKHFSQDHLPCSKKDKIPSESPGESLPSSSYNYVSTKTSQEMASDKTVQKKSEEQDLTINRKDNCNAHKKITNTDAMKKAFSHFLKSLEDRPGVREKVSETDSEATTDLSRTEKPSERNSNKIPQDLPQESSEITQKKQLKKRISGAQRRKLKRLSELIGCSYEQLYKMCVIDCSNSGDKLWCEDLKDLVDQLEKNAKKKSIS